MPLTRAIPRPAISINTAAIDPDFPLSALLMIKLLQLLGLGTMCANAGAATITVSPWTPVFQGIDLASGQQQAVTSGERNHQVLCYRVDLTQPGLRLFTTP